MFPQKQEGPKKLLYIVCYPTPSASYHLLAKKNLENSLPLAKTFQRGYTIYFPCININTEHILMNKHNMHHPNKYIPIPLLCVCLLLFLSACQSAATTTAN